MAEGIFLTEQGRCAAGTEQQCWNLVPKLSVQCVSDMAVICLGTAHLQFPVPLFAATAGLFP